MEEGIKKMTNYNHSVNAGFCRVQKNVVSTSKAAAEAPFTPDFFEGLDDKTITELRRYFAILIDTCELMTPVLEAFLKLNAAAFRANGIKFYVTPQVMMELYRNLLNKDEEKKLRASRGWSLIGAPEYRDIFDTYPPSSIVTHADPNLIDAARTLKIRHEKNVLILTSDKKLTSSIFNACYLEGQDEEHGQVQVLFIDAKNAKLTRYHASRLEFLADGVLLPDWSIIGEPKVKPWVERYFHDSIYNGCVFMDSCALRHALGIGASETNFCSNLKTYAALRPGQKINIVTTSLYDPEIRSRVEAMTHLFNVIEAINPRMREDDAIFHAMLDEARNSREPHMLLITNKKERFSYITSRIPTTHKMQEFWGCFIDGRGLLRKTVQVDESSQQAA